MTPALDALLKEVDRAVNDPRSFREDAMDWSLSAQMARSDAAPRLAAMLRVAVGRIAGAKIAADSAANATGSMSWQKMAEWLDAALARIEAMAKGEA